MCATGDWLPDASVSLPFRTWPIPPFRGSNPRPHSGTASALVSAPQSLLTTPSVGPAKPEAKCITPCKAAGAKGLGRKVGSGFPEAGVGAGHTWRLGSVCRPRGRDRTAQSAMLGFFWWVHSANLAMGCHWATEHCQRIPVQKQKPKKQKKQEV